MSAPGFIYAVMAANGLVKIGFSKNPRSRAVKINSDASSPCRLLGFVEASVAVEAALHRRLAAHRVYSEWYRHEGLVREFVDQLPTLELKQRKEWTRQRPPRLMLEIAAEPKPKPTTPGFSLESLGTGSDFVCGLEAENGLLGLRVSNSPVSMLRTLRRASPVGISIVFAISSSQKHRALLQAAFAQHISHADWFKPEGTIKSFFDEHRGKGADRVLEWQELLLPEPPEQAEKRKLEGREKQRASMRALWSDPQRKSAWLKDLRKGWLRLDTKAKAPPIQVPSWVPDDLSDAFLNLSEKHGEEFAASQIRHMKTKRPAPAEAAA